MNRLATIPTIAALLAPAPAAMAQAPANVPGEDGGLLTWGIAAGLALVVLAAGFLNPKRSHLT